MRLYVYGFVRPDAGDVHWQLMPCVNKAAWEVSLEEFALTQGIGPGKRVVLVVDGAGWHTGKDLRIPEGIHLVFLPPCSPQLQPAERLWPLTQEAVANRPFSTLDMIDAEHPEGLSLGAVLVPGPERPAWHAFDLVQQLLGDEPWDTVERIGGTTGLRGYRLERDARTLWVVWSEDGVLQLPGEAESTETLLLETDAASVTVTVTPTTDGGWASETVAAVDGEVTLTLGEAPVFVEDQ
ncbi:MAG: transposase [Alphaproteobacteria bacterium]|nr:transposase [Alphaproteobacteria bacterium]